MFRKKENKNKMNDLEETLINTIYCPKCGSREKTVKTKREDSKLYEFRNNTVKTKMVCCNCGSIFENESKYQIYNGTLGIGV